MFTDSEEWGRLSEGEKAWALHAESLRRRAHDIAQKNPGLDPGDIYHALRCLELTPAQRLQRGLSRGRLGARAR